MEKRTEQEWRKLHEAVICAFIAGRAGNYVQMNCTQCIDEAIFGADYLVKELKNREEKESNQTTSRQ